jgi:hypothetical protein
MEMEPDRNLVFSALPLSESLAQIRANFRGHAQCLPLAAACFPESPVSALCLLSVAAFPRAAEEAAAYSVAVQEIVPHCTEATLREGASCGACARARLSPASPQKAPADPSAAAPPHPPTAPAAAAPGILSHIFGICESGRLDREVSAALLRAAALPLLQSGAAALAAAPPPPAPFSGACLTAAHAAFARCCLLTREWSAGAALARGGPYTEVAAGTRGYDVVCFFHASGALLLGGGDAAGAAAALFTAFSLAASVGKELANSALALDAYRKWALASLLALPYGAGAPGCPPDAALLRAASPSHAEVADAYCSWALPAKERVALIDGAVERGRAEFAAAGAATLLRVVRLSASAREVTRMARAHSRLPLAAACEAAGVADAGGLEALLRALPLMPDAPAAALVEGGAVLALEHRAAPGDGGGGGAAAARLADALRATDAVAAAVRRAEEAASTSVPLLRQALRASGGGGGGGFGHLMGGGAFGSEAFRGVLGMAGMAGVEDNGGFPEYAEEDFA